MSDYNTWLQRMMIVSTGKGIFLVAEHARQGVGRTNGNRRRKEILDYSFREEVRTVGIQIQRSGNCEDGLEKTQVEDTSSWFPGGTLAPPQGLKRTYGRMVSLVSSAASMVVCTGLGHKKVKGWMTMMMRKIISFPKISEEDWKIFRTQNKRADENDVEKAQSATLD